MSNDERKTADLSAQYQIERVYVGERTAEELIMDLIKAHARTD